MVTGFILRAMEGWGVEGGGSGEPECCPGCALDLKQDMLGGHDESRESVLNFQILAVFYWGRKRPLAGQIMPSSHLILCCPFLLLPQSLLASESFPISQLLAVLH